MNDINEAGTFAKNKPKPADGFISNIVNTMKRTQSHSKIKVENQ